MCVAGAEQIKNMTPRDRGGVPCGTRNQWRRKNDTARWFHTFFRLKYGQLDIRLEVSGVTKKVVGGVI